MATRHVVVNVPEKPSSSELAGLTLDTGKMEVLAEMNAFHIEGRYPESLTKPPTKAEALNYMARAEGVF